MGQVYLGLGSNLGDRGATIRKAVALLSAYVKVKRLSSLYETEPEGFKEQPLFLNAVLEGETELSPQALLEKAKEIEHVLGRTTPFPNAPRPIDIDLLFYNGVVMATPQLTLPHPRLHQRAFVLVPLAELAPDLPHPTRGKRIRDMLAEVGQAGVKPWPR